MKTRVAVFFGGRSPEHDVSIVTGLQVLSAIDQGRYTSFPVYVATDGTWLIGDGLMDQSNYLPNAEVRKRLKAVSLDVSPNSSGVGKLVSLTSNSIFSKPTVVEFDVALLAFHGSHGENGSFQGLFELAGVPYTGMRVFGASVSMDKLGTKRLLAGSGIQVLPSAVVTRPANGLMPSMTSLVESLPPSLQFPVIVKPMHLGSSIAVFKAENLEEIRAALPSVFLLDYEAIIEPFVDNLVEYNISVRQGSSRIETSAIERPIKTTEILDFMTKYKSGGSDKLGVKRPGEINPGLLALTREINGPLPGDLESTIRSWGSECFARLGSTGAPRIDFLCNSATGELWLNEVNPCPGSFGYFLWEAAEPHLLFSELLSSLVDEAKECFRVGQFPQDPTDPAARLFPRK